MLRFAPLLVASMVVGVAQDARRLEEVAASHASNQRFMGSVLVAKDDAVLFERSYGWASIEWSVANTATTVGSSRVDLQACKLEYSIVSPK